MSQGHSAAWDQLWGRAADYYRQALDIFPNHPQALTSLGLALYEMQDFEESLRVYQQAAVISPLDPIPLEKCALLFERLGGLDQAAQTGLRAAELYLKNREVNKALENWGRVTRLDPENLVGHARLALVYDKLGQKDRAVGEYIALASLFQARGDIQKAVQAINQALQTAPNNRKAAEAMNMLKQGRQIPKPVRQRGGTAPLRMAQVRQLEAGDGEAAEKKLDPVSEARQKALTALADLLFEVPEEEEEVAENRRGLQAIVRGAGGGGGRSVDRTRIWLHLSQVVDLQTRGKGSQALTELERAVEAGLESPAAYFDLGYLQHQDRQYETALANLQLSVRSSEFSLGSRLLLGDIYRRMDRTRESALQYLEALKLADAEVVPAEYADDLRQLYDPVIEAHRQQSDEEYLARLCANVRDLLLRSDWRTQLEQARKQLPSLSDDAPPMPLAEILTEAHSSQVVEMLTQIHQLAEAGHTRSALEESFYALQHAPSYLPLHTYMGDLLLEQGQTQDAIGKYTVVARAYSTRGEPHRAVDMYRRVLRIAPMDLNAHNSLIEQYLLMDKHELAIQQYMDLAEVYYNLADLDMARKTYTDALRQAQQSRVDRSWRVRILYRMADIDMQSLDWRQALRIYEQIRTLQPEDRKARSHLIDMNFRLGLEQQALGELDNYLRYLGESGQRDEAVFFIETLVDENPERSVLRFRLADVYRHLGRTDQAIEQLDAAGEALLEAGDRAGAIRAVQAILAMNPPNVQDYQRLLAEIKAAA